MVFNKFYFHEFLIYTSNQVVKKYLIAQENSFACTMWARTRLRVRYAAVKMGEKMRIFCNFHHSNGRVRGFFARNRAHAQMVHANGFF